MYIGYKYNSFDAFAQEPITYSVKCNYSAPHPVRYLYRGSIKRDRSLVFPCPPAHVRNHGQSRHPQPLALALSQWFILALAWVLELLGRELGCLSALGELIAASSFSLGRAG